MADILLFRNMYIKTLRIFCYMKFVQHTETNIKQTNVKWLGGLQVKWLTITVNNATILFHWYIRV